jgi:hypothetical protein
MNTMDDPLKLVTDLAPAMLDKLADDGWARHRHGDLARAAAECPGRLSSARGRRQFRAGRDRPRRRLLTGGVAVTAAAAVALAAVVLGGAPSASRPRSSSPGAVPGAPQSARGFLLASAVKAASAPAATGAYWYTKTRLVEATVAKTSTRKYFLPGITYAETEESWSGQTRSRTIVNENLRFSFASAAVKAKWRALGEPPLATASGTSTQRATSSYNMTFRYSPGYKLTMAGIERLPTTAAGLDMTLRRMWNSIPDKGGTDGVPDKAGTVGLPHPTFGQYLVLWADTLLTGPTMPGTKAAMYRLLAQQPGIRIIQPVTDPLGRTGVAVADGEGYYLIIDPQTAQELASTSNPVHANSTIAMTSGLSVMEAMGWTSQIGVAAHGQP